jgi:eukaryotic-like serine/threonine-protein kinase
MSDIQRLSAALADRYRVERELGAGGMATVYLAADLKHDRQVAIKVLKPELAAVLGADRFVVEIKTTAALQHPHILPLFDSGSADGFLFYVMPFIEGETLRAKLNRETQLGVDEAVRITTQVADALDYAHRRGVIHRDIKPENILMHDGRPMVADFGIALAVSAAAGGRMTETGLSLGTPHYMSPEQATADKEISGRADVYSLASVLYEMLTGDPPHTGATAQQIIMKIITEPAAAVTKVRKNVPPNVAAALAQALEKLPADRFESAKAFADALANRGWTSTAFADGGMAAAASGRGASRGVLVAVSAVAVLATAVAAFAMLRPAPPQPVARFPLLLPDSQALSVAGNGALAQLTPDGRTLVYVGGDGPMRKLWVRPLDQLVARPLAGTEGALNPAVSPDGTRIAFLSATSPRSLKVVPIAGGPVLTLTDSLVDLGGVSWGHDGYIYYDGHLEGDGVARIKEAGGSPEVASRPDSSAGEVHHNAPSVLPNGRGVLFVARVTTARGSRNMVGVLDTRTGTHRLLVEAVYAMYAETGHLLVVSAQGTLMAVPFDANNLKVTGDAVLVGDGVAVRGTGRVTLTLAGDRTLAYVAGPARNQRRELVWVTREGVASPVDSSWSGEMTGRPALSPDDRAVAIGMRGSSELQVWVKQLDRGPASRVADVGAGPSWSPDGRRLVFSQPGAGQLQSVPSDGSALPTSLKGVGSTAEITSDGAWLTYQWKGDVWARRTSGDTSAVILVQDPVSQLAPSVSPDGRWLTYSSDETGSFQVYVRPFPDTKLAKRQVSIVLGYYSRWSRSGRELFYFGQDALGTTHLYSVDVPPGPVFTPSAPKLLFPVAPYMPASSNFFDVSADGKRFLFTRPLNAGAMQDRDRIVLVQQFTGELQAKMRK